MGATTQPVKNKITVLFVGGNMEDMYYSQIDHAKELYPPQTKFMALIDKPGKSAVPSYPISADNFFRISGNLLHDQRRGDIFHFLQLGHAGGKNAMDIGDSVIEAEELAKLFKDSFEDPTNIPYIAMMLGSCASGNYLRSFLKNNFMPDFFYASSPPFTLASGAHFFSGLRSILVISSGRPGQQLISPSMLDLNGDGEITLREMAVTRMNIYSPLAIMCSKRGSPDMTITGKLAKKPFFPKEAIEVKNHGSLIKKHIERLIFGEQAAVLVEGNDERSKKLKEWFINEAKNGDGWYRFYIIKNNPESRKFFGLKKDGSAIFAMGPNLRYHGVKLKEFVPIGDQIPQALANENPDLVIKGWRHKLSKLRGGTEFEPVGNGRTKKRKIRSGKEMISIYSTKISWEPGFYSVVPLHKSASNHLTYTFLNLGILKYAKSTEAAFQFSIGGHFKRGVWLSEDKRNLLSLGFRPELNAVISYDPNIIHSSTTTTGTTTITHNTTIGETKFLFGTFNAMAALEWTRRSKTGYDNKFSVSAGPSLQFDFSHRPILGWAVSSHYLFDIAVAAFLTLGPNISYFNYPENKKQILTFGLKLETK